MSRSPFEFDVSVSAARRRRQRERGMSGVVGAGERRCDWENCSAKGVYRAPASRRQLDAYRWFCQDHIRLYNARWNYYDGMDADEIDAAVARDQLWGRPTWRMGEKAPHSANFGQPHAEGRAWERFGFADPLDVLGENATINPGAQAASRAEVLRRRLPKAEAAALDALGLPPDAAMADIRRRYADLVKDLHPDHNGGDRSAEDRLKSVIAAWTVLKRSPRLKR